MSNILNYLEWRGDLSIKCDPFHDVDGLILSTFSYIEFENIESDISGAGSITIEEAGKQFMRLHADEKLRAGRLIPNEIFDLFDMLSRCQRFQSMRLSYYENQIDEIEEKQFAAITIDIGDGTYYIAYRGTDDTIVGWKEDFNMSYKSPVPSQLQAVEYLEKVANKKKGLIRLGGHSKGGNVSVYAAAFSKPEIRSRILKIHNFDGPGFDKTIIDTTAYRSVSSKVRTIVPQSSIIGMLLEHEENYQVVASTFVGIFQHDPFSWQVLSNHFIQVDDISATSYKLDTTLREFILSMNKNEKEKFVDTLFYVMTETGAKTLSDLNIKEIAAIIKRLNTEEPENKLILSQAFKMLVQIAQEHGMKTKGSLAEKGKNLLKNTSKKEL